MSRGAYLKCDPAHGANKNRPGAAKKRGENKGIAADKKLRKRIEAEARNARTPEHRQRRYRLNPEKAA